MDAISTARQFILDNPWAVVAIVIVVIVLMRGIAARARRRAHRINPYTGAPKDGSAVPDSRPIVRRARRQMILTLIALVVVAILVIMQNLG